MTTTTSITLTRTWIMILAAALTASTFALPVAAHGPGGEDRDGLAAHGTGVSASPRVESKSQLFELVGRLEGSELSIMINRFETSEPVLDARVEVATDSLKAVAKFHADHGDFSVDDAAFLKGLSAPGEHALVFTIVAGGQSDLLEGVLKVAAAPADDHGHSHRREYAAIAAGVLGTIAVAFALWRRRQRNRTAYVEAGRL